MTSDKQDRKERPIARGCLDYFPDAIAEVAHVSFVGSKQHHPGQPMHWDKSKSPDHADCIARHLIERGTRDTDGSRHSAKVAWRALAMLQVEIEAERPLKLNLAKSGVYLCGPMRGYPKLNFPAFHKAAALGRSLGFTVVSPAESGNENPDQEVFSDAEIAAFARRDIDLIFQCNAIALLGGWKNSIGATAEVALARWLGLPILDATTFKALEA